MSESIPVSLGRYVIQGEIGRGMMGAVYRAADPDLGRSVALKTVRLAFAVSKADREQFEQRFLAEARAAGQLSHPGIVVVHDVGRDPETQTLFIALEYLEGRTLERVSAEGPLDWREALRLAARIAEALNHAHSRGIVHRDVKPANIMILPSGDPKIMDFGIAKLPASQLTLAGQFFGTPAYMSPEQAIGGEIDGRSDLFSLGAILYQMLTGTRAFGGTSVPSIVAAVQSKEPPPPSSVVADLPEAVDYIVARALGKAPADRYPDGAALAEDLDDVRAGREPRHRAGWTAPPPGDLTAVSPRTATGLPRALAAMSPRTAARASSPSPVSRGERSVARATLAPPRGATLPTTAAAGRTKRRLVLAGAAVLALGAALGIGLSLGQKRAGPRAVSLDLPPSPRVPAPADREEAREPAPQAAPTAERAARKGWPLFPTLGGPAGLVIDVEHSLKSGRIRAWLDDDLVLDQRLQARVTKQILVYKSRRGGLSKTLEVAPGEHVVRVQVDSGEATLVDKTSAHFERGVTLHLQVDVGGLLKKRLSLTWG